MAKESMKARELKRQKLVEKYAEKRAALKAAGESMIESDRYSENNIMGSINLISALRFKWDKYL